MPATHAVDAGDERRDRIGGVPIPPLQLVLLGVPILLVRVALRLVLTELVAAVDAIGRHERRGEEHPQPKRRRRAVAQRVREDVRGVGPEVGPQPVGRGTARKFLHVARQLVLCGPPGEIRVALGEADLGQLRHHLGSGERLGEEDHLGVRPLDLGNEPSPERHGLGVRVVDAEDAHPEADPVVQNRATGLPESPTVLLGGRPEVDRVDVLILLGGVLRVLDRPVRSMVKPLGVLGHPGVVGRALQGVVERDLHPQGRCLVQEVLEVRLGPEVGMDRVVATQGRADRPR